jgi:hypothetical protein
VDPRTCAETNVICGIVLLGLTAYVFPSLGKIGFGGRALCDKRCFSSVSLMIHTLTAAGSRIRQKKFSPAPGKVADRRDEAAALKT